MKELLNIKKLTDDFLKDIEVITTDYKAQQLAKTDDELISCCGDEPRLYDLPNLFRALLK